MMRLIWLLFGLIALFVSIGLIAGAITTHQAGQTGVGWFMGIVGIIFGGVGWKWIRGKKSADWRNDPATAKQKSYADSLGIRYRKNISKGELSDRISAATDQADNFEVDGDEDDD